MKARTKTEKRRRRHLRLRNKVHGTSECPRMSVSISNKKIFVQIIDDDTQCTLVSAVTDKKNVQTATSVGREVAEAALEKGIKKIVFDRSGFKYGKRLKVLADAAREAGLEF